MSLTTNTTDAQQLFVKRIKKELMGIAEEVKNQGYNYPSEEVVEDYVRKINNALFERSDYKEIIESKSSDGLEKEWFRENIRSFSDFYQKWSLEAQEKLKRANMAESIISMIRNQILVSIASSPTEPHDPWDEEEGGAGWCDNEISLFRDLYEIAYPDSEHGILSQLAFEQFVTVAQFKHMLESCEIDVLAMLQGFVARGGSNYETHFILRENRDIEGIISLFSETNNSNQIPNRNVN